MAIISISGKMGAGKDLVGRIIQYLIYKKRVESGEIRYLSTSFKDIERSNSLGNILSKYITIKFADKLKDIVCLLIGCTRFELENRDFKERVLGEEWWYYKGEVGIYPYNTPYAANKVLPLIKPTPRTLLQQIGTDLFRNLVHPNTWVNATMADYKDTYNWIITDCRFPNEADAVKARGGINIRVNRPCVECGELNGHKLDCCILLREHSSEKSLDDYQFDYVIDNTGTIEELIEKVNQLLIKINVI